MSLVSASLLTPLLTPLLTLLFATCACAPHVAYADPPRRDDADADERARERDRELRDHEREERHAHGGWSASGASATIDEVHDAKPTGEVDVRAFAGSVRVTGWAQNQVKVHANVNGDCRVELSPSGDRGDRLEVRLECSHGPGSGTIDIQVPQASTVDVRTMSAGIAVQGVGGALRLQTVAGDVDVKGGGASDVEARSTSGSIHLDTPGAQTRAQSVSGDVTITGARGKANVHTVSGDCKLSGGDFSDVRVESVSGDVSFTGGIVGSFEVSTHSGDVGVHVPAATNADVELRTFSGDLVVDVGGKQQSSERELDAKIGVGGARIHARTFSGNVLVSR